MDDNCPLRPRSRSRFRLIAGAALALLLSLAMIAPTAFAEPAPTAAAAPDPPQNLTATALSSDQIQLDWTASPNAEGYQLYRSTSMAGSYVYIDMTHGPSTGFQDVGLQHDTTYYYYVLAVVGGEQSAQSNIASATTLRMQVPLTYYRNHSPDDATNAFGGQFSPYEHLLLSNIGSVGVAGENWVRPGYVFNGWSTDPLAGSGFMQFTMPQGPASLYATWSAQFAVAYDGNGADGGIVPVDPRFYAEGESVTVLPDEPSLTGHAFGGWTNTADGALYHAGETFLMTSGGTRLVAHWIPQADTRENTLALENDDIFTDDRFSFLATGHRQDESGTVDGETRYVPVSWSITADAHGDFPNAAPYRSDAALAQAGPYTLTALFAEEAFSAHDGWQRTGTTEPVSLEFTVKERPTDPVDPTDPTDPTDPVDPVDPGDPVSPNDPTDPAKPADPGTPIATAPGSSAQGSILKTPIVSKARTASLPKTGDASLVALGALGVVAILGGAGALVAHRRRTS